MPSLRTRDQPIVLLRPQELLCISPQFCILKMYYLIDLYFFSSWCSEGRWSMTGGGGVSGAVVVGVEDPTHSPVGALSAL